VKLFFKYLRKNWIFSALFIYETVAVILSALSICDIGIPCLFTTIFGIHCWGCGMTHAAIALLKFQFAEAWNENPLVVVVIPLITFAVIQDFLKFKRRISQSTQQ
jgi:predicted membrane metal-binding protein